MNYIESRCVMVERTANVVVAAFSDEEAQRLTGVSLGQLRSWSRTSFFAPSLALEVFPDDAEATDDEEAEQRIINYYSFRDLVSLQVLHQLRNKYKIPLQHLRKVKDELRSLDNEVWAKQRIYVLKNRVNIRDFDTDKIEDVLSKQGALIPLEIVRANMERAVYNMRERNTADMGKIQTKRGVARSKPVIAGTGILVSTIKEYADAGYNVTEIIKEYPSLTEKDVEAAISYKDAAA